MKLNVRLYSLILGVGLLLTACTKTAPTTTSTNPTPTSQVITNKTIKGTLQSLLATGQPAQCTFTSTMIDATVNGTVLSAKGKMKGDITTVTPKMTIVSHMIVEQPTMYIWTDQSDRGMKMMMPSSVPTASPVAPPTTTNGAPNLNQEYTYNCTGWTEDDSVFTLPTNVTFTELNVTVPAASGAKAPTNKSTQCAVCENVPAGAGRNACLTQLHCQ